MGTWLNVQIEWIKSFLSEPTGKASSKRAASLGVVIVFLIAYLRIALATSKIEDIPSNWMFLIAGIIGLGIVDKAVTQKTKPPTP